MGGIYLYVYMYVSVTINRKGCRADPLSEVTRLNIFPQINCMQPICYSQRELFTQTISPDRL